MKYLLIVLLFVSVIGKAQVNPFSDSNRIAITGITNNTIDFDGKNYYVTFDGKRYVREDVDIIWWDAAGDAIVYLKVSEKDSIMYERRKFCGQDRACIDSVEKSVWAYWEFFARMDTAFAKWVYDLTLRYSTLRRKVPLKAYMGFMEILYADEPKLEKHLK